ncbi:MAG: OmpA family protein [Bacteroidota bacterium]
MKTLILSLILAIAAVSRISAQVNTVSSDKAWKSQHASLQNAYEAEFIIRIGDVDNLGFGWPENFDPFCNRMTDAHDYPWEINGDDLPGMDRILLSSEFDPTVTLDCGQDGYTGAFDSKTSRPVTYSIPTEMIRGVNIQNAWLQLFIDDFQAPSFCSRFRLFINGKRFAEGEKIINAIDQTGPVGKLVSIPVPAEFFEAIASGDVLTFKIDEIHGAGDGFAIDFIRLIVNRIRENSCMGNVRGFVVDKHTDQPIANALVISSEKNAVHTNSDGWFEFMNLPTGFEILTASATGFADGSGPADIGEGDMNPEVWIFLEKGGKSVQFDDKSMEVGESINLKNIQFDQGKAGIKPASVPELDKVVAFMKANPQAEIELSGHTSAEGDPGYNRILSYQRVKSCKDYITGKGIDTGRIIAVGFGPDRPVAPNDNETNRAKNRRVEMRIVRL